jgi:hypothetical protein
VANIVDYMGCLSPYEEIAFSDQKPDFDDFLASRYVGVTKTSKMRSLDSQYRFLEVEIK